MGEPAGKISQCFEFFRLQLNRKGTDMQGHRCTLDHILELIQTQLGRDGMLTLAVTRTIQQLAVNSDQEMINVFDPILLLIENNP